MDIFYFLEVEISELISYTAVIILRRGFFFPEMFTLNLSYLVPFTNEQVADTL